MGVQEAFDVFVVAPEALHDDEFRMIFVEVTEELDSEIEHIVLTDELPQSWTYPEIQPGLIAEARRRGAV